MNNDVHKVRRDSRMTREQNTGRRDSRRERTRQRIVEATIELHETVGTARTTISAIAEKAGGQRLTVYRHFPTNESCSKLARGTGARPTLHPTRARGRRSPTRTSA